MSEILNAARNFHKKHVELNPNPAMGMDGVERKRDKHVLRIAASIGVVPIVSAVYMVPLAMTAMIPGASTTFAVVAAGLAGAQVSYDLGKEILKNDKSDLKAGLSLLLDGALNKFGIASREVIEKINDHSLSREIIKDLNQNNKDLEQQNEVNRESPERTVRQEEQRPGKDSVLMM